ncbi:hypothetical protein P7K49_027316, partial [Saguinus oedipus]
RAGADRYTAGGEHPLHPLGIPEARRWSLLTPAQRRRRTAGRARPPKPGTRAPISAPRRPGTLREKASSLLFTDRK